MSTTTPITPKVPKVNVTKTTFDILFQNIMNGKWKVGEKIPSENELRNSLSVSRHTIRSAIANLNMLGIIESRQGDGNYVKSAGIGLYIDFLIPYLMINQANIPQIIEFRKCIEVATAKYATLRATEEDLDNIGTKLNICNVNRHNTNIYPQCDMDFHVSIAVASKNELLLQSMNVIRQYCFDAINDYFNESLAEEGANFHQNIYAALLRHDATSAEFYMTKHMDNILERVQKQ